MAACCWYNIVLTARANLPGNGVLLRKKLERSNFLRKILCFHVINIMKRGSEDEKRKI